MATGTNGQLKMIDIDEGGYGGGTLQQVDWCCPLLTNVILWL